MAGQRAEENAFAIKPRPFTTKGARAAVESNGRPAAGTQVQHARGL